MGTYVRKGEDGKVTERVVTIPGSAADARYQRLDTWEPEQDDEAPATAAVERRTAISNDQPDTKSGNDTKGKK